MKQRLFFALMLILASSCIFAQVNISSGGTASQDFSIGTSQTAALPTGWKADKNTTARTLGTYSGAVSATEQIAGNNMSSSASNGIYNYAAGDPTSATDRAVGWISSSSATKSGNLYVQLYNNGASQIPSFTISYAVEKYRMGTNSAGFSIQMYYSTNGTSWTSAGADFLTSYAGSDASNNGYASAPGATQSVTSKTLNVSLNASSSLYLAWNYAVTSGSTTSNAQGLGVDDVYIVATSSGGGEPTIVVDGVPLDNFGGVLVGQSSDSQSYTVSGTDLEGDIEIYAPGGFEISDDDSSWETELFLSPTSGEVDETTIYVRFSPSAVQAYSGNIEHSSSSASTVNVAVAGTGIKGEPTNHPSDFEAGPGTNPATDITLTWTDAIGAIIPDGYLIKGSTVSYDDITSPVDGVSENNSSLVQNVIAGNETYTFQYLSSSTTHYFKIFPYTNSGTSINYKTDGTIQTANYTTSAGPEIAEVILPQYIQGLSGTNNQRLPYACRLTLQNLTPNATYRYFGMFTIASDGPTTNGAGIQWFVNSDNSITRSTSLSLAVSGQYSEFTTNGSGSYTGWFIGEPSGNTRFAVGNNVFYRIMLNDGNDGTAVALRLTTTNSIKVINFGTEENVNQGTFLYGVSGSPAKNFCFVYDNEAGTGRPIAGTIIESDGLDLSGVTQILTAYKNNVDGEAGAWGVIIPNSVGTKGFTGIKRVESRELTDGTIYAQNTDSDGNWNGVDTTDPTGGDSTPLDLTGEATLPVELSSFTATLTSQSTVNIMWVTQTETNVNGYYVYRGISSELNTAAAVSSLIGATNTSQQQVYQFTDTEVFEPGTYYYWLQVQDLDGSIQFHGPTTIYFDNGGNNGTPVIPKVTELKSIYPNPFNPNTTINYSLAKAETVDFVIYNNRGQIVRSFNEGNKGIGNHNLRWNGEDQYGRPCSTGVYYIKMNAGKDSFIRKAVLMK